MTGQMQKHIHEVNEIFYDERKRVQERYKEYDDPPRSLCAVFLLVLLHHWYRHFRLDYLPTTR